PFVRPRGVGLEARPHLSGIGHAVARRAVVARAPQRARAAGHRLRNPARLPAVGRCGHRDRLPVARARPAGTASGAAAGLSRPAGRGPPVRRDLPGGESDRRLDLRPARSADLVHMSDVHALEAPPVPPSRSRRVETLLLLARNPMAVASALVLLALSVVALLGELITPHDPFAQTIPDRLQPPSGALWFGTDELGRDVFSRVLLGAEVSLRVGFVAVGISLLAGTLIGLAAGYYGRWLDDGLMRFMDVLFAFPAILLAIVVVAVLGPGITNAMI